MEDQPDSEFYSAKEPMAQFYMARALKALRIHHCAKKEEVAEFLDSSVETVKILEKGGIYLTDGDICKYAKHFRVPVPIIICLEEHIRNIKETEKSHEEQ